MGTETEKVYVDEFAFGSCKGCRYCKTEANCILDDGYRHLWENIIAADGIAFGSPVYMGQVTGQAKLALDRLYFLLRSDRSLKHDGGSKKGAVIIVCGTDDPEHPQPSARTLDVFFRYLQVREAEKLVVTGVGGRGEVAYRPEVLQQARAVGRELASPRK